MFQKDQGRGGADASETIIGPSVKVEGDLKGLGNVIVEGIVKGTITTDQDIRIGKDAQIVADIVCSNLIVAGSVQGSIQTKDHLDIKSSAKIKGDISTGTISIESGAQINGKLSMGGSQPAPAAEEKEKEVTE